MDLRNTEEQLGAQKALKRSPHFQMRLGLPGLHQGAQPQGTHGTRRATGRSQGQEQNSTGAHRVLEGKQLFSQSREVRRCMILTLCPPLMWSAQIPAPQGARQQHYAVLALGAGVLSTSCFHTQGVLPHRKKLQSFRKLPLWGRWCWPFHYTQQKVFSHL